MFSSKMFALLVVSFVLAASDAQYLASPYYYQPAAYSAYAYPSVYSTYAQYPAFYGWGANKGKNEGQTAAFKMTNNQ